MWCLVLSSFVQLYCNSRKVNSSKKLFRPERLWLVQRCLSHDIVESERELTDVWIYMIAIAVRWTSWHEKRCRRSVLHMTCAALFLFFDLFRREVHTSFFHCQAIKNTSHFWSCVRWFVPPSCSQYRSNVPVLICLKIRWWWKLFCFKAVNEQMYGSEPGHSHTLYADKCWWGWPKRAC